MNLRSNHSPNLRKAAQTVAAIALMLAAAALTARAQAPTRFTVAMEGATTGPAVLLLPGLSSSQSVFDAEAKLLAPTYRLYRVQVAGFSGAAARGNANASDANPMLPALVTELHQYITAQKIHPAVIGHSLGGLLGLMLADAHPEDVQKLLIVDSLPFYALVFKSDATVDEIRPQAKAMRDGIVAAPPAAYEAQATQTSAYLSLTPSAQRLIAASSLSSDRNVMAEAMYEDLLTDLRPRLASIKTPATLLYPYDAKVAGPDSSKVDALYTGAYATMPNVKIHRIDDSRHFIMYDQPEAFDTQVQAFLK
jgi:pimeloyl-ACP methyl ester carboxylesterase